MASLELTTITKMNIFWATYHVEVQSVDADAGVVLNTQVNVFLDTEAEVSGIREVVLSQLVLTHLEEQTCSENCYTPLSRKITSLSSQRSEPPKKVFNKTSAPLTTAKKPRTGPVGDE